MKRKARLVKSAYLDTNTLIYANFFLNRAGSAPDLTYFMLGQHVVQALDRCRERDVRVLSTDLVYLEMHHNYYEWAKLKRALEEGAPMGLLFARGKTMDHMYLSRPLNEAQNVEVLQATVHWLREWDYSELVEFVPPEKIPAWFQIARHIYARHMETVIDCLHVAAAIALECDYFITQDKDLRKFLVGLREDKDFIAEVREKVGISQDYPLPSPEMAQTFDPPPPIDIDGQSPILGLQSHFEAGDNQSQQDDG